MAKRGLFAAVVLILLISSCRPSDSAAPDPLPGTDSRYRIETSIDAVQQRYVGLWQRGAPSVASGYDSLYLLLPDGTFVYAESQYAGAIRLRYLFGEWAAGHDSLLLTIKSKAIHEGGVEAERAVGSASTEIAGGHLAIYIYGQEEFESIDYPAGDIEADERSIPSAMRLGESMFYRIASKETVSAGEHIAGWNRLFEYRRTYLAFRQ